MDQSDFEDGFLGGWATVAGNRPPPASPTCPQKTSAGARLLSSLASNTVVLTLLSSFNRAATDDPLGIRSAWGRKRTLKTALKHDDGNSVWICEV